MSFSFGFGNSPVVDIKSNFIANYGSYAQPYDALDAIGNQKFNTSWPVLLVVLSIVLMIVCFVMGKQEVDPKTNQPIEKTNGKKIATGLAWLLLLTAVFGGGYGAYLYFAVYLPQYAKWFESLPSQAKASLV
jgi:hypothetical protein